MLTMNGTGGEWVIHEVEFDVFTSIDNYVNLYFSQSGIDIGGIRISKI